MYNRGMHVCVCVCVYIILASKPREQKEEGW